MHRTPSHFNRLLGLLAALLFVTLSSQVALADEGQAPEAPPAEAEAPPAEAPPAESGNEAKPGSYSQFAGEWDSEWGKVQLTVDGNKVTGTFLEGTIEGEFDANGVLFYKWKSSDNSDSGVGAFNINGDKLVGRWGYGISQNNGGDWSLWRPKK